MSELIGLSGWRRSGKDTTADILVKNHGFVAIAFADVLRDFLEAQDPWVCDDSGRKVVKLGVVIKEYGWQGYKTSPFHNEMRTLIVRTGTEAGRQKVYENIWVDAAMRRAEGIDRVVFSDVRFPNEAEAVRSAGGKVWRIQRHGVGPESDHPSERSLDDYRFDCRIHNDSNIEELVHNVKQCLLVD